MSDIKKNSVDGAMKVPVEKKIDVLNKIVEKNITATIRREHIIKQEMAKEAIYKKYEQFKNALGTPIGDITTLSDGWWKQEYVNSNNVKGAIYYEYSVGTFAVYGAIYARYKKMQLEKGILGFPKTDELGGIPNGGRYNHFENGSIYWTSATGACAIMQIGEVTIPFSQSIQEPELSQNLKSLEEKISKIESTLNSLKSLEEKISKIESTLNSLKTNYDTHTHSYGTPYMGGAWNLATLKDFMNKGKDMTFHLVRVIKSDNIPSTPPTGLTSKPQ